MKRVALAAWMLLAMMGLDGQQAEIKKIIEKRYTHLESLYTNLHQNPELSGQEANTSRQIASELKKAGYSVTENFSGFGIVGVMKNGEGPTVLIRTDMDALPLQEKTGLNYASRQKAMLNGKEVEVMHACGHDMHMTVFTGTAYVLSALKERWKGTLILVAQPAEETSQGAKGMLDEGLYETFGTPDYALAYHVSAELESGRVGYCSGPAMAGVSSVNIIMKGQGGHGAYPHKTIDPVVLSARAILAIQTIVSRETSPLESSVVTVGAINGGFKHNVIPDEVEMLLTLRSYSDELRSQTIEGLERITKGIAVSAGVPEDRYPEVIVEDSYTPPVINDIALTKRWTKVLGEAIGEKQVVRVDPVMAGEDFGRYGYTEEQVPICLMWLGTVSPDLMQKHQENGTALPPLHSPLFAPYPGTTIRTGVQSMAAIALNLLIR
ncbi:MAG: amidohydrolase [Bacteroidota bacterium]